MKTNTTEPTKDPMLGTYTPVYVAWAETNLSDDEFIAIYGITKADAKTRGKPFSESKQPVRAKLAPLPPEAEVEDTGLPDFSANTPEDVSDASNALDQVGDDLENMHHKTFEKQYGMKKAAYKTQNNL
tara:strand:+ start:4821 stop:5204 length:384 start_codon:yes stop_codon:yes gene_type:complete